MAWQTHVWTPRFAVRACSHRPRLMTLLPILALSASLLGSAGIWLTGAESHASPLGVVPGDRAPDFDLVDLDGVRHTLSEERGSVVLLFFFGYNSSSCRNPARQISDDLLPNYGSKELRVLGIDCWDGAWQAVDGFRQDTGVGFPLLMLGSSTASSYDLPYNSFVVVDSKGLVRYMSAGPENSFDLGAIRSTVDRLLEESNETREATWGAIKSLFSPKRRAVV